MRVDNFKPTSTIQQIKTAKPETTRGSFKKQNEENLKRDKFEEMKYQSNNQIQQLKQELFDKERECGELKLDNKALCEKFQDMLL
jgi:hypothetical protein